MVNERFTLIYTLTMRHPLRGHMKLMYKEGSGAVYFVFPPKPRLSWQYSFSCFFMTNE